MHRRLILILLSASLVSAPLLAERHKVRVYFGIDLKHPYIRPYYVDDHDHEKPEYGELRGIVLQGFVQERLKERLGFVDVDQSTSTPKELRFEIADKDNDREPGDEGEREVFFRIKLRRFVDSAWVEGAPTYWSFRVIENWSRSERARVLGPEIVQKLTSFLNNDQEFDRMVREQFVALAIAPEATHLSKAEFEVPVLVKDLFIGPGTYFQLFASIRWPGRSKDGFYGANFNGKTEPQGQLLIGVHRQEDINEFTGASEVRATNVSIIKFRYAPQINDSDQGNAFQKKKGP